MQLTTVLVTFLLFIPPISNAQQQTQKARPKPSPTQPGAANNKGAGVTNKKPPAADTTKGDNTPTVGLIRAKISTSRPEVTVNGGYGVFADLENIGAKPVTLYSKETELVVQPEVTQSTNCVYRMDAFFPTEMSQLPTTTPAEGTAPSATPNPSATASPVPVAPVSAETGAEDPRGVKIRLQPNEHYAVFWDVSILNTTDPNCKSKTGLTPASFVPGEYAFTIDGKAYLVGDTGAEDPIYHTFTEKTVLRVSIPQTLAMWAAAVGAIIAFLVTKLRTDPDLGIAGEQTITGKALALLAFCRDLFSAALMGAVVTVITSRLSETQFPIKVSVNDFWGALTIGFFAYFIGTKLIDKLVGSFSTSRADTVNEQKSKEEERKRLAKQNIEHEE